MAGRAAFPVGALRDALPGDVTPVPLPHRAATAPAAAAVAAAAAAAASEVDVSAGATPTNAHLHDGGSSPFGSPWALRANEDDGDDESEDDDHGAGPIDDVLDDPAEDVHAEGIPAARGFKLDVREEATPGFQARVLELLCKRLALPGWREEDLPPALSPLDPAHIRLRRISGAMTNAVYFVSYQVPDNVALPTHAKVPSTVLLRVYGIGAEALLSRRGELLILHTLSSLYEIGPHILGTFANGRVEEYFRCDPIGREGIRDLGTRDETLNRKGHLLIRGAEGKAHWVARRMRELHEVPLDVIRAVLERGDLSTLAPTGFGRGIQNHIMASSHRPRHHSVALKSNELPSTPAPATLSPVMAVTTTPMSIPEPAKRQSSSGWSYHSNTSTASFDSLATSFDSQDSFLRSPQLRTPVMGPLGAIDPLQLPASNGVANANGTHDASPSLGATQVPRTPGRAPSIRRRPYPGVWRRCKRWTREADKVVSLVEAFTSTPAGQIVLQKAVRDYTPSGQGDWSQVRAADLPLTTGNGPSSVAAIFAANFAQFKLELDAFKRTVRAWEAEQGQSKRVFSHNDSQYGNLLVTKPSDRGRPGLNHTPYSAPAGAGGMPRDHSEGPKGSVPHVGAGGGPWANAPHHQIVVIDFEYASPNPRAYDIANHFHEWRADYHHPTLSWSLTHHSPYPTKAERRSWLRAYVQQGRLLRMRGTPVRGSLHALVEVPADFSLGPPAVPVAPAPPHTSVAKKDPSGHGPTLTPFLRGLAGPASNPLASPSLASVAEGAEDPLARLHQAIERDTERLDAEVRMWSPATHAVWALWGLVYARTEIEAALRTAEEEVARGVAPGSTAEKEHKGLEEEPFDCLRYALGRIELWRAELAALGIKP